MFLGLKISAVFVAGSVGRVNLGGGHLAWRGAGYLTPLMGAWSIPALAALEIREAPPAAAHFSNTYLLNRKFTRS